MDILFWLGALVIGVLIWRRVFRRKKPAHVADPNKPAELVVDRQRMQDRIVDAGSHANPRGEILSKPGSLRIPADARADAEAERRRRRDDSSGGDGFVVINSQPHTGTKASLLADNDGRPAGTSNTTTKDTGGGNSGGKDADAGNSDGGGDGGGCGD